MVELIIDPEFRDLIPPLTGEEYQALEKSLIENGFNPAFRIIVWKDQNIVIDGHNRLGICQRNNIPYEIIEQEFASRYDAMAWIIDNQLARRNINAITRNDLIGRRYSVEKNISAGRPKGSKECPQNEDIKRTGHKIADQLNIGHATVERAEKLSKAIDIITANTGISRADILSGRIRATQDDIKAFAELDAQSQKKIIEDYVTKENYDIKTAMNFYDTAETERRIREAEEQKKQMEERLRIEREEKERQERERLRIEREEKEKQEKERLARIREQQEKERLEKVERERQIAIENAKTALEQERIKKEKEEQLRIERERIKKEHEEQERIEKQRLEKIRLEQEKKDEEELERLRLEQERADAEKIEEFDEVIKTEIPKTPYDPYLGCSKLVMEDIDFDMWIAKERKYRLKAKRFDHENPEMFGRVWADILDAGKDTAKLTERIIESYTNKCIEEAFVIVKNETDTTWFMNLMYTANAVVFPVSAEKSQLRSHALVYYGKNIDKFMKYCEQFGWGVILNK